VLTARQSAFVREYPIDMVGTAAAVRAGYSARSAKVTASRLLAHPEVKVALSEAMAKHAAAADVKATDVVARLRCIAMSDPGGMWSGSDVLKAIEMLGRWLKMFSDKVEVTGGLSFEQLVLRADMHYREAKEAGRPLMAAVSVAADGQPIYVTDPYEGRQQPATAATAEVAPTPPTDAPTTPAPAAVAPEPALASTPKPGDVWHRSRLPWEGPKPRFAETSFNPFRKPDPADA
jgi:hypothetical protein